LAALGFLGLGVPAPQTDWGTMLSNGVDAAGNKDAAKADAAQLKTDREKRKADVAKLKADRKAAREAKAAAKK